MVPLAAALVDWDNRRQELPLKVAESQKRLIAYFDSVRYDQSVKDAYRVAVTPKPASSH